MNNKVVIIGAGPAGLSLACSLVDTDLEIIVLKNNQQNTFHHHLMMEEKLHLRIFLKKCLKI